MSFKQSDSLFNDYLRWSAAVDALIQGAHFIFKTKNDDWRLGQVTETITNSSYDTIKIKLLDEQPERVVSLRLDKITEFHVVPKGATKEAAIILYGKV